MADDFDSVLSGVKADAETKNAAPDAAPNVSTPEAGAVTPELRGVLDSVKNTAQASAGAARTDADLDNEIASHQKQKREYQGYQDSQKSTGFSETVSALSPKNVFHDLANLQNPEVQARAKATADFIQDNAATRLASAFGHGVYETMGAQHDEVTQADLDKYPIKGEDDWQNSMNEFVVRPAIMASGAFIGAIQKPLDWISALPSGAISAAGQLGEETGSKQLQAFPTYVSDPNLIGGLPALLHAGVAPTEAAVREFVTKPPLPLSVLEAVNNGIIKPSDPDIKTEASQVTSAIAAAKYRAAGALVPDVAPPTIEALVKKSAPEVYSAVTAASDRQDLLRRGIENLKDEQRQAAEDSAPHSQEDLQSQRDKVENPENARKAKLAQAKLDKMEAENKAHIEENTSVETPEITGLREGIESLDLQKRDLAKESSDARRTAENTPFTQAEHNISDVEWSQLKEAGKIQTDENGKEFVRAGDYWDEKNNRAAAFAENQKSAAEEVREPIAPSGRSPEEQQAGIVAHISQEAQSAGIDKEQAELGAVLQARGIYGFFGRMFGISAEEMYEKHAADFSKVEKEYANKKGSYNTILNVISIMKGGDISTMMHEGAHHFLVLMDKFSKMPDAPKALLDEMATVRKWLQLKEGDDLAEYKLTSKGKKVLVQTRAHEQFARGFEQYLREGKAPSADLVPIFSKMKQWFNGIYQSVKNIKYQGGKFKLTDEARAFFDRTLSENPETQIEAKDHEPASAATHEGEAATVQPGKEESVADSIESDIIKTAQRHSPEIADAIKSTDETSQFPETVAGDKVDAATPESGTGRKGVAEGSGKVAESGVGAEADAGEQRATEPAAERNPATDDRQRNVSKPAEKLFDKAGNIRLENLTNEEETRAALRAIAAKTPLLDHDVIGDQEIAELAKALGVKAKEINIEKLRQLAIEDDLPLAARVRASREMLLEADKQVRELAGKVENGTSADLQAFTEAHNRFLMISETVSAITNQIGRALRAFQDISGDGSEAAKQLETLFQQEMANSAYDMKDLARLIATKTESQSVPKMLQASIKPGFWDHFAEYRRCSILSGFVTHALWLTGTGVNLLYKPIVLDTLGGIHNEIGMAFGRKDTGSTVSGGIEGLYRAITKALPNILSATGTAIRTGKTVLRPFEGELDTYLATGGIRKTLNINMDALRAATDSAFNVADYPDLKALQDKITVAVKENNADKVAGLQLKLDEQSLAKKKEVAQKIAAQMQVRLKTWGELAGEIHDFGASTMASALAVGKNIVKPIDFIKDKPVFEARREEGVVPDIYVKGVPVAPVGTVMRGMSSRIYSSMHTFARETAANIETLQEARRIAVREGLKDEDLTDRVNDLLSNPTKELMREVNRIANKQTLMSNESEWAKAATRIRNAIDFHTNTKIGSVLMPVIGVPAEAVRQTVAESSPLGLLDRTERAALRGKMGATEQERAQVKMVAGTALIGLGIYLGQKGLSTPSPSVNYNQEQERRDAGQQSGSIRIGDMMVGLQHVPVTGTLLTLGADLNHILETYKGTDISDRLKPAVASAVTNFLLHENALAEVADAVDAIRGKSDVASYLKNQAVSTIVPAFVKQGNDLLDPNLRESKSFMSSVLSRTPGESETLAPRINSLTGEPLPREPLHMHTANPDPIAEQLMALHMYPTNPHPNINNSELSTQQAAEYSSFKGHILHNGLQMLMQGEGRDDFNQADVNGKRKMIQRIELHASQCAKSAMFNRYPELLKDANDKYEASCVNETR